MDPFPLPSWGVERLPLVGDPVPQVEHLGVLSARSLGHGAALPVPCFLRTPGTFELAPVRRGGGEGAAGVPGIGGRRTLQDTVALRPPVIISEGELDELLRKFGKALDETADALARS